MKLRSATCIQVWKGVCDSDIYCNLGKYSTVLIDLQNVHRNMSVCLHVTTQCMVYMKMRGLHTPLECHFSVVRKYEIIIHVIFMGFA